MATRPTPRFVLRLVERTASQRLSNTRPERFVIECGWECKRTSSREKPGMVGLYLANLDHIADALEALAELWRSNERHCRNDAGLEHRIMVGPSLQ